MGSFVVMLRGPVRWRISLSIQHSVVLDFSSSGGRVRNPVYRQEAGAAPTVAPGESKIWAAQASGAGSQSVVWSAQPGDWAVVVMNADGTSPVASDVAVGATFPGIGLVIWVLLAIAAVMFVQAVILMVLALRSGTRSPAPGAPVREAAAL